MNAKSQVPVLLKRKRFLLLILSLLILSVNSSGQFQPTPVKRSNNQITISGKNYYLHEVLKGQTLFGISKEYQVSEDEIKKTNPELSQKSIFPGMVLRIPDLGTGADQVKGKEDIKFIFHTVLAKETMFSLSRQYGIKVDEIRELNPETKGGLKIGMVVRIPEDKITLAQKIPVSEEKNPKAESIDTSESVINGSFDQPCIYTPFPHTSDDFKMAVLLPLNISQNDSLYYSDTLKPEHFRFYEFLEGMYIAMDSMRMEGLNLTVEVFDTERNSETLKGIVEEGKLDDADLIIGPVFPNEIEIIAAFSRSKQIPMVSPLSTYDVVTGNPYAFQVRTKLPRQVELATTYLGSKYMQNVIVIGRYGERENVEFKRFLENLGTQIMEQDPAKKATFKTVYFSESSRSFINANAQSIRFENYLSTASPNFIILPSENEVFITEVINQLNLKSTAHQIHVFGLNQWVFQDLDLGSLYNVNLELYSDFEEEPFVDFTNPLVQNFNRKYKENWNIEPSRYSFQGFDIAWFFTRALFQFGRNLTYAVPCWEVYLNHPSMLSAIRFSADNKVDGFENKAVTIIRYQKDELLRRKVN